MKKAIALLVAFMLAISLNVGAMAAPASSGPSFADTSTAAAPLLSLEKNQLVLGFSVGGGYSVVLPETFLQPGHSYTYQLFRVDTAYTAVAPNAVSMTPVTDAVLNGAKLRIRSVKGSANVVNAKIEKKGSGSGAIYNMTLETKETFGTKVSDLEYTIVASGQAATATDKLLDARILFKTGYRAMLDTDIEYYNEGDTVTISTDRPVITKSQFETLAKNYNYRAVEFMGEEGDWRFIGRVSGMGDANFTTSHDVAAEIIIAYPDQDYKFLTFNGGVNFPTNGEMRIDVSEFGDDAELFAYLYRDGALTPITATYDNTSDEIVFRTNYLGAFVITTAEINDLLEEEIDVPLDNTDGEDRPGTNPPTGAAATGSMAALALASLTSGVLLRKKRKSK